MLVESIGVTQPSVRGLFPSRLRSGADGSHRETREPVLPPLMETKIIIGLDRPPSDGTECDRDPTRKRSIKGHVSTIPRKTPPVDGRRKSVSVLQPSQN